MLHYPIKKHITSSWMPISYDKACIVSNRRSLLFSSMGHLIKIWWYYKARLVLHPFSKGLILCVLQFYEIILTKTTENQVTTRIYIKWLTLIFLNFFPIPSVIAVGFLMISCPFCKPVIASFISRNSFPETPKISSINASRSEERRVW